MTAVAAAVEVALAGGSARALGAGLALAGAGVAAAADARRAAATVAGTAALVAAVVVLVGAAGDGAPAEGAVGLGVAGAAVVVDARRPAWWRAVVWGGVAVAVLALAELVALVGDDRMRPGAVVALAASALALQLAAADRGGAARALMADDLRGSILRALVLPVPVVATAPLVAGVVALAGEDEDAAELLAGAAALALVAATGAGTLVSRTLANRITVPLRHVRYGASRITAGLYDASLAADVGGPGEVRELAGHFDGMRRALERRARLDEVERHAAQRVGAAPDLGAAFDAFFTVLCQVTAADRASLYVRRDGEFVTVAAAGAGSEVPVDVRSADDPRIAASVGTTEAVVVGTIDEADAARFGGARAYASIPVVAAGQTRAILTVSSAGDFGPDDVAAISAVARGTTVALDQLLLLDAERRTAQRLRELDALKNEFVGIVAHDLRSPMHVIAGFADTLRLRWDDLPDERKLEFLARISRNVGAMSKLVDDVLDVARMESGDLALELEPLDLGELVRRTVTEVAASRPGIGWTVDVPADLPPALADGQRQWQVLSNLLTNACKYSAGRPVEVAVRAADGYLQVSVADHGPGIPPGQADKLFTKFSRLAPPPGDDPPKGTGLGLYIARVLVEAQGGTIRAGETPGGGATFSYTVPVAP